MSVLHQERLAEVNPYVKDKFLEACDDINKTYGYDLLVVYGKRSLEEQAKLFRQGRTLDAIKEKAQNYRNNGLNYLADILMNVGPQKGNSIITKAGPGESIHNWGCAIDYVRVVDGEAKWNDSEAYKNCTEIFTKHGFECGFNWKFKDSPHVQMTAGLSWRDFMTGKTPKFKEG